MALHLLFVVRLLFVLVVPHLLLQDRLDRDHFAVVGVLGDLVPPLPQALGYGVVLVIPFQFRIERLRVLFPVCIGGFWLAYALFGAWVALILEVATRHGDSTRRVGHSPMP